MAILRDRTCTNVQIRSGTERAVWLKNEKIFCQKIRQMILNRYFQGIYRDRQEPEALIGQPMRGVQESNICNFDLRLIVTKN